MRCHYCREIGHFIRECEKKKLADGKAAELRVLESIQEYEEDVSPPPEIDSEEENFDTLHILDSEKVSSEYLLDTEEEETELNN